MTQQQKEVTNQQQQTAQYLQQKTQLAQDIQSRVEQQGYQLCRFEEKTQWLNARKKESQQYQSTLKKYQELLQTIRELSLTQEERKRYLAETQKELDTGLAHLHQLHQQQEQLKAQRQALFGTQSTEDARNELEQKSQLLQKILSNIAKTRTNLKFV